MAEILSFVASLFTEPGFNASYQLLAAAYLQILYTGPRGALSRLGWSDNINPRETIAEMEKSGKVAPKAVAEVKRRLAAHQNSWEMLPMVCTAVIAGNMVNLPAQVMNVFMIMYIVLRGIYIRLYVKTETQNASAIRSLVWILSVFNILIMLYKAGNKLNDDRALAPAASAVVADA